MASTAADRTYWSSMMSNEHIESCIIGAAKLKGTIRFGCIAQVFCHNNDNGKIRLRPAGGGPLGIKDDDDKVLFLMNMDLEQNGVQENPLEEEDFFLLGRIQPEILSWQLILSDVVFIVAKKMEFATKLFRKLTKLRDNETKQHLFIVFQSEMDARSFTQHLGENATPRHYWHSEEKSPYYNANLEKYATRCKDWLNN